MTTNLHMTTRRRTLLATALAFAVGTAGAQTGWPSGKPIRIVVTNAPGGITDISARTIGQALSESLKNPVVVDNKPGASGFIGASEAARAAPDGYTLLVAGSGTMGVGPKLHESMPFDSVKDFAPIALLVTLPVVVVVNPLVLPVSTIPELVAHLKSRPGQANFAHTGAGGTSHVAGEYFKNMTGTSMVAIPYKSGSAASIAMGAGDTHVMFDMLTNALPLVQNGKLRILATTGAERLAEFPEVPTVAEALNIKGFDASSWTALYAPAGTPPEIVKRLSAEVNAALKHPAVVKSMRAIGALPAGGSPQRLADYQRSEQEKWGKVIKEANIKLQ